MKVILSRKGFDSGYGKCPNPILEDGTLLSLPIPAEINDSKAIYYSDLSYNGKTYDEIWKALCPKHYVPLQKAHLDPDIRHRMESYAANKQDANWSDFSINQRRRESFSKES